jgi:chromosome segregation ATPase
MITESAATGELQVESFQTLHERISQQFSQQEQSFASAQNRVAEAERKIEELQRRCRELAREKDDKEQEVSMLSVTVHQLRIAAQQTTTRNQTITESEQNEAAQREQTREQYIRRMHDCSSRTFDHWRALTERRSAMSTAAEGNVRCLCRCMLVATVRLRADHMHSRLPTLQEVIDHACQLIGELEASFDTLASAPTPAAMVEIGLKQQVFACAYSLGGELLARFLDLPDGTEPCAAAAPTGEHE